MAAHSSTLAWKIPLTEEPGRLQSMGSDATEQLHFFTFTALKHSLMIAMVIKFGNFLQVLEKATPTGSSAADEIQSLSFHYIVFCLFMCTVIHTCIHSHILFHYGLP